MRTTVKMPRVSEASDLVVVLSWLVDVGAPVAEGAPLVSVETDKAVVDVPSPIAGTLVEQLAQVDDEVTAGSPFAVLAVET